MKQAYDCIVIGGGPAGSTVAALAAEAGRPTLLVEREKFPRFHVGESLMPETYWVLKRLGVLKKMQSSKFVEKRSVQFISNSGRESQPFFFDEHDPRECSVTWQVERAYFDQMLFDNAAEKGADCHDQTRVHEVLFEGDRAVGVRLSDPDGQDRTIESRVVVDATGQHALLANRLKLKEDNPDLHKAAIWGYYKNARRDSGRNHGATIIMHTSDKKCWFWFIPLPEDITSIGLVGDNSYLLKGRGSPTEIFEDELVKCPPLIDRLMDADLVSNFHVAKEVSYATRQPAGEGWVLVGDAYGCVDPIYSSGVFFALKSGEMAADCIIDGLARGDTSGGQLGKWAAEFNDGVKWIKKLVEAFYTNEFSFGRFMKEHPQHKDNLTDILIRRVFHDEAGRIFEEMDPELEMARRGATQPE